MDAFCEDRGFFKVFLKKWTPYLLIIFIGFLLYYKSLSFGFCYLDDDILILRNHDFLSNIFNIFQAFKQRVYAMSSLPYYRPMLIISFILDAQIGGINPAIYHSTNIIIHLVVSCLVFLFFKKLNYRTDISLLFAIIFTVHPISTSAVAWIPGRNDSMLACFILASFIFFLNYLKTQAPKDYFWHLIFFALALLTKETAVVLVFIYLLYFHLIEREKLFSKKEKKILLGWTAIFLIWILLRHVALKDCRHTPILYIGKCIWSSLPAVIQYIGKMFLPFNLSVLPVIQDTSLIYGFAIIVILLIVLIFSKNIRHNFVIFGTLWLALFIAPSIIRLNSNLSVDFIESKAYLPLVGFLILCLETDVIKKFNTEKNICLASVAVIIIMFSLITLSYSANFKNRLIFWENAVKTSPHSSLAHLELGQAYYLNNSLNKAEKEYKKSLSLNPEQPTAFSALEVLYKDGDFYRSRGFKNYINGKYDLAIADYSKAIEINPKDYDLYYRLGLSCFNKAVFDKAILYFNKTLEINPEVAKHGTFYNNRAVAYFGNKKYDKAWADVHKAEGLGYAVNSGFLELLKKTSGRDK